MSKRITRALIRQKLGAGLPEELVDFLTRISTQKAWFENVGAPHPRDVLVVRAGSWRAARRTDKTLFKVRGPLWHKLMLQANTPRNNDRVYSIYSKSKEIFLRSQGAWSKVQATRNLNRAYGMLGEDVGFAAGAIWMGDLEAKQFWLNLVGFYLEGHWPCGWYGRFPRGKLIVF